MEQDPEVKGDGNSYTTEFRQYDPRVGRWLSLDPLMHEFPWMSPYVAFNNNPIYFIDPLGLEGEPPVGSTCYDEENNKLQYDGDGQWSLVTQDLTEIEVVGYSRLPMGIANGDHTAGQGEDMVSGTSYNDILNSLTHSSDRRRIVQYMAMSDDQLFKKIYRLGNQFADGTGDKFMVEKIINHFKSNTGSDYKDEDLTRAANKHPSTNRFKDQILNAFQKEVMRIKGFTTDGSFDISSYLVGHPRFNETGFLGFGSGDEDNGLRISVNDVWTYKVEVVTYQEVHGQYQAQIRLTLYDHFGLDPNDMNKHNYAFWFRGFYAWYTLQKYKGYKPFVTVMELPLFTIRGVNPWNFK